MKIRIVPWVACALLIAAPAAAAWEGPVRTRYTLRLEELELARHRLLVEAPGLRLVYLEELLGLESVERRLGIALPFAVAGPLAPTGLWRKLLNPLAHGAASPAHEEATGLRLDTSFDASARRGAALLLGPQEAPGVWGGLGALETARTPLQGAGWLECGIPDFAGLTGLAVYSMPPPDGEEQAWFLPEVPYPGGGLLHLAAGARLASRAGALAWSGALSGGPLVRSGLFSELLLRLQGRACGLSLLGGVCSPGYRTPEGAPGDRTLRGAVRLDLEGHCRGPGLARRRGEPSAGLRGPSCLSWCLESELESASSRVPAGLCGEERLETEHRASVAAVLEGPLSRGASLRVRAAGQGKRRRLAEDRTEDSTSLSVSLRTDSDRARLEAEMDWRNRAGGGSCLSVRLSGARRHPLGRESLSLRATLSSPGGLQVGAGGELLGAAVRCDLVRPGWSLFVDLHTRRDIPLCPASGSRAAPAPEELLEHLGATLGWEVRAGGER